MFIFLFLFLFENILADPVTFSTALSQGTFKPKNEHQLFFYEGNGVMTYFWCTEGSDSVTVGETIFRYYVDGEVTASIEFTLDMLAGIGFDDNTAPWGNSHFGKGAQTGAIYSTIRIPFQKSINITGSLPAYATGDVTFWWIARGVEDYQINIGGVPLPANAKLQLYKNVNVVLQPLEYIDLVNTQKKGAVWMVVLSATSGNLNYLEGCFRMIVHGSNLSLLSSGTEDYFQSAFYFDAGRFWLPEAGLTHKVDSLGQLSAYKVHNLDILFFKDGGFRLTWRNGDATDPSTGMKCVDKGNTSGDPQKTIVTTYTWVYEW